MSGIWSIILAAGESKRMGSPKMLLIFNDKTMIENVISNVKDSDADFTLVVLGANSNLLTSVVEKSGVEYCINNNYKEGMLSSVQCGFRNLPSDYEAALIFQGDQPLISSAVINKVIYSFRTSGKGIVIPVYKGKRGHPVLIDRKYKDEINRLDSREGLRSLAYRFTADVEEVYTNDPGILRDFDTYEEYLNEINQKQ